MLDNFVRDAVLITDEPLEKEEALERIVSQLCRAYHLPYYDEILERIVDRESRLSTGIGLGIGVPHCKVAEIDHIYLSVMLSRKGIDYNSADKSPVHLLFLIISPEMDYEGHIKCLSMISKGAADESIRAEMMNAESDDNLFHTLIEKI